ncbi:hypothetical protein CDD81_285 [Ophiocordyceps australis]|uniref:PH domain-containing protein n=1 Tax=Ophiocordyceps australis TaxID=1399860 RepID=A0A2C5XGA4_9HYPO|nr:hypothetical protein CDD81_285 [Ophiocordyceps australis]
MDIAALHRPVPSRHGFFKAHHEPRSARPASVATVFVDTDWDDDLMSEPDDNSPRVSLQSSGQPSITTISSYDEVQTPTSSTGPSDDIFPVKQTQGPRGPHLFRSTADPFLSDQDEIWASQPMHLEPSPRLTGTKRLDKSLHNVPFKFSPERLDPIMLVSWDPAMVAQSMLDSGLDLAVAHRFIENDISGEILITLKFEDLRELNIPSFGIRTRVWHHIQTLRDNGPVSPGPSTPIENVPSREATSEILFNRRTEAAHGDQGRLQSHNAPKKMAVNASHKKMENQDKATPQETVSIIGIEQLVPKPHHCSKGENCAKWRRQQRLIQDFQTVNPHVDMGAAGPVLIFGEATNIERPRAIDADVFQRTELDAVAPMVASSDVGGSGVLPKLQGVHGTSVRHVQPRGRQANVRQYLAFQHRPESGNLGPTCSTLLSNASAAATNSHHDLRQLPRLHIPKSTPSPRNFVPSSTLPPLAEQQPETDSFMPYQMAKVNARSPDLKMHSRLGTPFSEVDVPMTAVLPGPIARQASQSVPPNMGHRQNLSSSPVQVRSQSRASFSRPILHALSTVQENKADGINAPKQGAKAVEETDSVLSRFKHSWSPVGRSKTPRVSSPKPEQFTASSSAASKIDYQGPMKKRKLRFLRHEWQDGYFTLKGTRLNMHKDAKELHNTLEFVDIDDYAIACSSAGSKSKLSAALKAINISHHRGKSDPIAAFSFQLIPQDKETSLCLRRRGSAHGTSDNCPTMGVDGTGKTHHFAVQSRDERIDWMRELMLAKARRQKGEGFQVSVNGNMI